MNAVPYSSTACKSRRLLGLLAVANQRVPTQVDCRGPPVVHVVHVSDHAGIYMLELYCTHCLIQLDPWKANEGTQIRQCCPFNHSQALCMHVAVLHADAEGTCAAPHVTPRHPPLQLILKQTFN